jgi:hypothetical protein
VVVGFYFSSTWSSSPSFSIWFPRLLLLAHDLRTLARRSSAHCRPPPVDSSSGACAVLSTDLCWRGPARWVPWRPSCRHCCQSSTPPHARAARRVDVVQCYGCCCDDPSSLTPVGRRGPRNPGVAPTTTPWLHCELSSLHFSAIVMGWWLWSCGQLLGSSMDQLLPFTCMLWR